MTTAPMTRHSDGSWTIPPGDHRYTETIDLGKKVGITVKGAGRPINPNRSSLEDSTTRLIYEGPSDQPAMTGCVSSFVVRDLQIQIMEQQTGIGFWLDPEGQSHSTGNGLFSNVCFANCGIGFLAGNVNFNGNAADMRFEDIWLQRTRIGFKNMTSQNVNYYFNNTFARWFEVIFQIGGGGWWHDQNTYIMQGGGIEGNNIDYGHGGIVYDVIAQGQDMASQTGHLRSSFLRWDQNTKQRASILLRDRWKVNAQMRYVVDQPHFNVTSQIHAYEAPMLRLRSSWNVVINDAANINGKVPIVYYAGESDNCQKVTLNRCNIRGTDIQLADMVETDVSATAENITQFNECYRTDGYLYPNTQVSNP